VLDPYRETPLTKITLSLELQDFRDNRASAYTSAGLLVINSIRSRQSRDRASHRRIFHRFTMLTAAAGIHRE